MITFHLRYTCILDLSGNLPKKSGSGENMTNKTPLKLTLVYVQNL